MTPSISRPVAVGMLVVTTFFWATNYLVGEALVPILGPVGLTFVRWALAVPLLAAAAWLLERPDWRVIVKDLPWHAVLAACGILGYNFLNYTALLYTDAVSASVVNAFNPAVIAVLAAAVGRERLRPIQWAGIGLSAFGVLFVITRGDVGAVIASGFNLGELLVIGAVLLWAVYTVGSRRLLSTPPVTSTAVHAAITAVVLVPFAPTQLAGLADFGPTEWLLLVYLVLLPTSLAFALWNVGARRLGSSIAGVFINLMAIFTALLGVALGQTLGWTLVVGGLVVVAGVLLANGVGRRR